MALHGNGGASNYNPLYETKDSIQYNCFLLCLLARGHTLEPKPGGSLSSALSAWFSGKFWLCPVSSESSG